MNSELIVVLVLIAIAIGFVIWVRMNSQGHDRDGQASKKAEEGERTHDGK